MRVFLKNIIHGSRLIYIYLITILVSAGILVYLSIQNTSNFRELTEKRILEEEKEIHDAYKTAFQNTIEDLTSTLGNFIESYPRETTLSTGIVSDFMVMSEDEDLIAPYYSMPRYSPSSAQVITDFSILYRKGEQLEFLETNLPASQRNYISALAKAKEPNDSARVYNALSRLQVKQDRPLKALEYYDIIISKFGSILDNFGLPYSYYSADQVLKLGDPKVLLKKQEVLQKFLINLNSGHIPYTENTENLLDELQVFLNSSEDSLSSHMFSDLLAATTNKAFFITKYKPVISDLISGTGNRNFSDLNEYRIPIPEDSAEEVFITNTSDAYIFGFLVPMHHVDSITKKNLKVTSNHFDYTLELIEGNQNGYSVYSYQNSFSPYLPKHDLIVRISNELLVSDFIFKRSLITIIGLVLLLAAMVIGFIMLVRDVARKKNMEKLRADFVANVTHELKTPLTSINMFADSMLLDRIRTKDGIKKYARIIVKESEKLKRMINNILEFSKLENDKLHYELKEEQVAHLIHEVMEEMNYWLSLHNFEVELNLDESLYVYIDVEAMKQVMSNLITNAIKYSTENKHIIIHNYRSNGKICIDVKDHGIGIPPDKLDSIFKKFYRVSDNGNGAISGTGLGLTVSKEIIEAMQGTLTAKSVLDEGSIFTITLNEDLSK